jgi:hypothetical protein
MACLANLRINADTLSPVHFVLLGSRVARQSDLAHSSTNLRNCTLACQGDQSRITLLQTNQVLRALSDGSEQTVHDVPVARFASTLPTPGRYRLPSLASKLQEKSKR